MRPAAPLPLLLLAAAPGGSGAFAPPVGPAALPRRTSLGLLPEASSLLADAVAAVPSDLAPAAADVAAATSAADAAAAPATSFAPSYSNWSYYTTLGLYGLSFPGLWSQVKRSTKAKVKRKTYVRCGAAPLPLLARPVALAHPPLRSPSLSSFLVSGP